MTAYLCPCMLMLLGEIWERTWGEVTPARLPWAHPLSLQDQSSLEQLQILSSRPRTELVWPKMKNQKKKGGEAEKEAKESRNEGYLC